MYATLMDWVCKVTCCRISGLFCWSCSQMWKTQQTLLWFPHRVLNNIRLFIMLFHWINPQVYTSFSSFLSTYSPLVVGVERHVWFTSSGFPFQAPKLSAWTHKLGCMRTSAYPLYGTNSVTRIAHNPSQSADSQSIFWAFILGILFLVSFCPKRVL